MRRRSSSSLVGLAVAALTAGLLAGLPVSASAVEAEGEEYVPAESEPNKNTSNGSSSAVSRALEKAEETDKPVEVVSQREESAQLFANPDGTLTHKTAESPLFAEVDGKFKTLNPDLAATNGRLEPKVASEGVSFSATGEGATAELDVTAKKSVGLAFAGDLGDPVVDGGVATYDVKDSSTEKVRVSTTATGFATHVLLAEAPTEAPVYRFVVDAPGLQVALEDGALVVRDGEKVVAQSKPLMMWDGDVDAAGASDAPVPVDAKLVDEDGAKVLELRPSMDYLSDPERIFPVTVDPDLGVEGKNIGIEGDTYIFETQTSSQQRNGEINLRVGSNDGQRDIRSIVYLSYKRFLGLTITDASLGLRQYDNGATGCAAKPTVVFPMTTGDVPGVTWGNQPAFSREQQYRKTTDSTFKNYGNDCAAGVATFDVTAMYNGWAGGHTTGDSPSNGMDRQAVFLLASNERDTTQEKRFCSENWDSASSACGNAGVIPTFNVTFEPELGSQDWYSMTDHTLDDRSRLSVNNRTGNTVVSSQDANVKGVGQDLAISRTYNSAATTTDTSLGKGWNMGFGPDVWLERKTPSAWRYDYHGPSSTVLGSFVRKSDDRLKDDGSPNPDFRKFTTPIGGAGADLDQKDDGTFTLKFRKSPTRYIFDKIVDGNAYLTKITDRDDNEILFTYASGGTGRPTLTKITDTMGRTYSVTYAGGRLSKIVQDDTVDDATREWNYTYTGNGQLETFTDAIGGTTTYAYTNGLLTSIVGPGPSATRHETVLAYSNADGEINSVSYRQPNGSANSPDFHKFTWAYPATRPTDDTCKLDEGKNFTTVRDPRGNTTTYCFAPRSANGGAKKVWTYDGAGNRRSADFTADNGAQAMENSTGATTVNAYSGTSGQGKAADDFSDRPKSSTQEQNAGSSNKLSESYGYSGAAVGDENAYLPSFSRRASGDCDRYEYDPKGHTTVAYSGVAGTSTGCSSAGANDSKYEREYDSRGNVVAAWDGNAPSSPTDAQKTIYTYFTSETDASTGRRIDPANGLLKSVRKPGGNCEAPGTNSNRKWCTSFTYDAWGRTKSMTDGRGKVTNYAYDKNDRQTVVAYNGVATSSCTTNLTACILYGYDAAGNLRTRGEGFGQSTFQYDRMNRLVEQTMPTGVLSQPDRVTMGYDGVGNMVEYNQVLNGVGQNVSYAYDAANRLDSVTENGETVDISTDKDGRTDKITFPNAAGATGAGVEIDYDFQKNGQPTSLSVKTTSNGTETGRISYDYRLEGTMTDSSQMQSRNISKSSFASHRGRVKYTYSKQRLASAVDDNGTDYEYDYDKIGNVKREAAGSTTTRFGYNRAGMLCWKGPNAAPSSTDEFACSTPSGNTTVDSDAAGNSTGVGTGDDAYTINERNQVTTVDGKTQTYLDQGNDLRRENGAVRSVQTSLGVTAEQTSSGTTFYLRDPNGTLLSSRKAGVRTNYVTEPTGDHVAWLLNTSGSQVAAYKYAPYGKTTVYGNDAGNRHRWLGAEQNTTQSGSDGHYKLGARYYDTQGHFTQPDPLSGGMSDPRTMTGYNYGAGDPINQADASGLGIDDVLGKALSAGGDFLGLLQGCEDGLGSYGSDRSCNGAVNGFVAGAIVTTACAVPTSPFTLGTSVVPCAVAGAGAAFGVQVLTEASGRLLGIPD